MRVVFTFSYLFLSLKCVDLVQGFEIPSVFKGMNVASLVPPIVAGPSATTKAIETTIDRTKSELLKAISFTGNGKDASIERQEYVLKLVRSLETNAPVSKTLLQDPVEAKALDGVWYLQYTSPSDIGSSEPIQWKPENLSESEKLIDNRKVENKGTVTAQGITVDTSNRVTQQIFDVINCRVTNSVEQAFGIVRVSGTFRPSETVPTRAVVGFDTCEIRWNNGLTIQLGFVFAMLSVLKGTNDNGWLETTYLDSDLRIGRGNKGSMFVLTRDRTAVAP
jgi:hypothetical protein